MLLSNRKVQKRKPSECNCWPNCVLTYADFDCVIFFPWISMMLLLGIWMQGNQAVLSYFVVTELVLKMSQKSIFFFSQGFLISSKEAWKNLS